MVHNNIVAILIIIPTTTTTTTTTKYNISSEQTYGNDGKASHGISDSHQQEYPHGRYLQQSNTSTSLGSATIPPFASLIANNFINNEALPVPISSVTGLSFAAGIAGTGLRGLFDSFHRFNYERNPQEELHCLLRQQQ